jgi:hypothetical protein
MAQSTSSQSKPKGIALETRAGHPIENHQDPQLSAFVQRAMRDFRSNYPMIRDIRNEPSGYYNCHGLTFASRRTNIEEPKEVWKILSEDGYKEIYPSNKFLPLADAEPGDVLVYFKDSVIDHTAIVVQKGEAPLYMPRVLAKVSSGPEVVCAANACPQYNLNGAKIFRVLE